MESLADILKRLRDDYLRQPAGDVDDSLPEPNCATCRDFGWVRRDVPVSDESFGKAFPCQKCQPSVQPRMAALRAIPAPFQLEVLESREVPPQATPRELEAYYDADEAIQRYSNGEDIRPLLVLTGPYGTGKTLAAARVFVAFAERGGLGLWVSVPDLLDELRGAYGDREANPDALLEAYRQAPLLVMDDFGMHRVSDWAEEKLYQLVNSRFIRGRRTVITTPLKPPEMEGAITDRLRDRRRVCVVPMVWRSYRSERYSDPGRWVGDEEEDDHA